MFFIGLIATVFVGGIMIWLFGRKSKPAEPSNAQKVDDTLNQQESEINGFEKKLSSLIDQHRELEHDRQLADDEVAKWKGLLEIAAPTKKESDIRDCVRGKMEAEQHQKAIADEMDRLSKIIEGLKEKLKFARTKIEDARANKTTLAARLEAAKISEKLADKNVDLSALEEETMKQEGRAEAYEETSPEHQAFLKKNTVANSDVDAEVERLMKG